LRRIILFLLCLVLRISQSTSEKFAYSYAYAPEDNPTFKLHPAKDIFQKSDEEFFEPDDLYIFYPVNLISDSDKTYQAFTMYKRVDKKIRPVSTTFSPDYEIKRTIPEDPLATLPTLPTHPPEFTPTERLSRERLATLDINPDKFLTAEEEKLFAHIMELNQDALAFEDAERGTFKDSYFSPYKIQTVPHTPWEYKNIPIPPGILTKVIEVLKLKMEAGVYEPCQSSYRSRWFCVMKKNGKLRIVHDLQPLNKVTVRDAGMVPILDDFVEGFAGRQCYTVFDLYWGFDARRMESESRDMTAFMTPLGLLRITSMPTGFTNSPAEFQKCMVFILHDEIPHVANIFIDDLPIKGPRTQYLDVDGNPETIEENSQIRRFIWEHAQDVHRIMHRIKCAGGTFSGTKTQICRPEVLIVGQRCNPEGRVPDIKKTSAILDWPPLATPQEVRRFLGLCGTVRIWILNYSAIIRPLTELYRKTIEFAWDARRQEAFQRIKELVASAPALRPIDYESFQPVILSVDSSREATGMILAQDDEEGKRRPARYGSVPMSERESRYSQPKLELFGLYRALRCWRLYIIGVKKFHVEVDAKFIQGILNNPDLQPDAAVNRWIQGILMFHFELIHVPATKFQGPDALSRRGLGDGERAEDDDDSWLDRIALLGETTPRCFWLPSLQYDGISTLKEQGYYQLPQVHFTQRESLEEEEHGNSWTEHLDPSQIRPFKYFSHIHQHFEQRPTYEAWELPSCHLSRIAQEQQLQQIKRFLRTLEMPDLGTAQKQRRFITKASEFFEKNERLWKRKGSDPPLVVVMEPEARFSILRHAHDSLGHRGERAMQEHLKNRFFWPHMHADIKHHIASCPQCQVRSTKRVEIPPMISAPIAVFRKIYIDVMKMPASGKLSMIVAARDDLTGFCEAKALTAQTSQQLANFFWTQIYCRYGCPQQVTTDNGSEVKAAFEILMKRLRIPQITISSYNKHANGVVERGHFTLREAIVKACNGKISRWPRMLAAAVFADRVTVSSVTGYSPFQLLHATLPVLPFDLAESTFLVDGFYSGMSTSELLALRIRQLQKHPEDIARAAETLRQSRFKSKLQFEKRFRHRLQKKEHKSGDLVLLRNSKLDMSIGLDAKTEDRYLGPYEVHRKNKGGAYILKELDGSMLKGDPVAAFRLLPYITRDHWFMRTGWMGPEPADGSSPTSSEEISSSSTEEE
jgi:hypothetical protein